MKKADYQLIGHIFDAVGFGVLLLGVGLFFAGGIAVGRDFWGNVTALSFPNAPYAIILGIMGIILLLIGIAFHYRAKQEREPVPS